VCAQSVRRLERTVRFATLSAEIPQAQANDAVRELRIKWTVARPVASAVGAATPAPTHTFALVDQRVSRGALPRDRRPELSTDQLVVVVLGVDDVVLDWRLVRNPRLMRAESPGPDGVLSGTTVEFPTAELSVAVVDVSGARTIRIYQPRWTGTEFMLDAVGDLGLTQ
jgi:hypothetical protein